MRIFPILAIALTYAACSAASGDSLYFPPKQGPWETVSPSAIDWNGEALERALDYARDQKTSALVVLYRGRIVAERYWDVADPAPRYRRMVAKPTADGHVREDVASVQKSVTSFLCGAAERKGLLDLSRPVSGYLGAGWSNAPANDEQKITVHHLLSMSSGLDAGLNRRAPAGTRWQYNTNAYAVVTKVLESIAKQPMNDLTRAWLTGPAGMSDTQWEPRTWLQENADANTIGLATSAPDLARFGLLLLANGVWDGTNVLQNPDYLKRATSPSQTMNPAYGLLFWLNGQASYVRGQERGEGSLNPAAPGDMFMAAGALNRRLFVVPSEHLVIARLGDQPDDAFDVEFWKRLREATDPQ